LISPPQLKAMFETAAEVLAFPALACRRITVI